MINPEKRLDVNPDASLINFKPCQRGVAHFVMACSTQLGWGDEDMFRVGELYSPDTNGTVKVRGPCFLADSPHLLVMCQSVQIHAQSTIFLY